MRRKLHTEKTITPKAMFADRYPIGRGELAILSPYSTRHIQRCGAYQLSSEPPPSFEALLSWALPHTNP